MRKKIISLLMTTTMMTSLMVGCGSASSKGAEGNVQGSNGTTKQVSISFYTTETGKDDMFQSIITNFEADNPGIKVEYIAAGDDQLQKWMSLYASNEGPTVSFMDPINIYENQERMRVYTKEECSWLDNIVEDSLSCFTYNDKIYGIPGSAAGFGLLYNQRVLDQAVGGTFDPATIKTRDDLKALFEKIEATGTAASMFTGVNWSLGAHYLGLVYGAYRGDVAAREAYVDSQKNGQSELINDEIFNNLMDTFDLIAEYNYNKADPLVANVNMDAEAFATGKVGTWFMGDWAWTYFAGIENQDKEFGILPIPVNNDSNDKMNKVIPTSYAKGYCVDASQNSEEQQQAGLKFVEYITSNETALQIQADRCGQAFPYKNFNATIESPFGQATAKYIREGNVFDFYGTADLMPSDFWYENGANMCEYLAGASDRATLSNKIGAYWKAKK